MATKPTNKRIVDMTEQLTHELEEAEAALLVLRDKRRAVNDEVRAKVAERNELRSALARLTPRGTKPAAAESVIPDDDPILNPADDSVLAQIPPQ